MLPGLVEKYQAEGAAPLVIDRERIAALGLELVERPVAAHHGDFARHDPDKLAEALGLPENEEILMILDLGYAAEGTKPLPNHASRKPLSETVAYL